MLCTMDLRNSAEKESDLSVATELQCRKQEQEKLSGVVKSVHRKLRRKYIEGNVNLLPEMRNVSCVA